MFQKQLLYSNTKKVRVVVVDLKPQPLAFVESYLLLYAG